MSEPSKLYILWTNADPVTSDKMVMMYGINCKLYDWWEAVTIMIWGATANLPPIIRGYKRGSNRPCRRGSMSPRVRAVRTS